MVTRDTIVIGALVGGIHILEGLAAYQLAYQPRFHRSACIT